MWQRLEKQTIREAQAPGGGRGVDYFYQAITGENEQGQEIIVEWSRGCGKRNRERGKCGGRW